MVEDTGRDVKSGDIKKAYKFGGSQVLFTPIEQQELKNFGAPILRIIGFKRQSMLPIWASVKKSTFIYPSEEDYIGSTRVFAALWKKLLKDKIMGVAWYIARKNASPMLVAILPSQERLDEAGVQVVPAGLWLYPLPFADDIRSNPEVPKPLLAPDNLVDEMRKVVQQVRMPVVDSRECWEHGPNFDEQLQLPKAIYDPSKYPNPSLQWHYKILQAMALEEEIPTIPEDKTEPKFRQIHKRAGEYISNWGIILDQQVRAYQKAQYGGIDGTKLKRDSEDAEEGGSRKRVKTEKSQTLGDMSTDDLKKLVKRGDLGKRTIPELKELLKNKGMSTSGKKTDLVDRIEAWVEDN
jgi:ATP-dependent DNA helicase 2 subunit 1